MKKRLLNICLFVFLGLITQEISAQGTAFIQNKGQWPDHVYFKANIPSGGLFLEQSGFTYYFTSQGEHAHASDEDLHDHLEDFKESIIKTTFLNANTAADVQTSGEQSALYNYYIGNDPKEWGSGAKGFEAVLYNDLYKGIDLKIYQSAEAGYKYDFIVAPNVDPSQIKTEYTGYKEIYLSDGHLIITHNVGQLVEVKPFAYQMENGVKNEITCHFEIKNSVVSFSFPHGYDQSKELVIDPDLIFSTFSGATSNNFGMTATYDQYGNGYTGGVIFGNGYPTTPNMAQDTFGGGNIDVAISKYSSDGSQLLYTTFFGGSNSEMVHSMVVNSADELLFFGTTSSKNMPTNALSLYDTLKGGPTVVALNAFPNGSDIFIARISANGDQLLSSTYFGGSENDGLNMFSNNNGGNYTNRLLYGYGDQARGEINIDPLDNVYIISSTYSADFPTSTFAYSNALNGKQDAIVAKFSPDLNTLHWSTYLGGSENEVGYAIRVNSKGDLYVAGGTISSDFPTTANSYSPTYNGGATDGFISKLSSNGSTLLSSTFIGTNDYDQTYFIDIDKYDDVYAFGHSFGGNFPVNNANYVDIGAGQFIIKLDSNLTTNIFSTTVGSRSGTGRIDIAPTAFLVDRCQNIYVSGWGTRNSTYPGFSLSQSLSSSMPITPDAFKSTTHGANFYFLVLKKDAESLIFGSFFGGISPSGEHVDGGTSRFDQDGIIYQSVCAGCGATSNFPVKNAYYPTNTSVSCSNALFKVSLEVNPEARLSVEKDSICAPATIEFENTSKNSNYFIWDLGNGVLDSINKKVSKTFTQPGVYSIKLIVGDSICGTSDTLLKEIKVFNADLTLEKLRDTILCTNDSINIIPNYSGTVLDIIWSDDRTFIDRLNAPGVYSIKTWIPTQQMYYIEVRGPGCSIFDSILVRNEALDNKFIISDTAGCSPLTINLSNISNHYDSLIWSIGTQKLTNVEMPTFTFNTPGQYTVALETFNYLCKTNLTKSQQIEVYQSIKIDPINDTSACSGGDLTLSLNDYNTANRFIWSTDIKFTDTLSESRVFTLSEVNSPKRYYVSISNDHCDTVISFMVSVPILNINLLDSIKKCSIDTIEIEASSGNNSSSLNYLWTPNRFLIGPTTTSKITTTTKENITYYLDVSDKLGCHFSDSILINVTDPIVDQLFPFTINDSVPIGKSIYLESDIIKESFNYQWTPEKLVDSPNQPITRTVANTDTLYQLFVFDEASGCSYKGRLRINVYDDECSTPHIFVPSAFTPNNDFSNDVLYVRGNLIETFSFQVFNRWGELVFESNDLSEGWNGNYKGEPAQEGVYVFQLKAKCYSGQEYFLKGDVTLIR